MLSQINPEYIAEIQGLSSFYKFEMFFKVGGEVHKTINCFTFAGIVLLMHNELPVVLENSDRIRAMEESGSLFCVE
jgi:hypothetical protein